MCISRRSRHSGAHPSECRNKSRPVCLLIAIAQCSLNQYILSIQKKDVPILTVGHNAKLWIMFTVPHIEERVFCSASKNIPCINVYRFRPLSIQRQRQKQGARGNICYIVLKQKAQGIQV